MKIQGQKGLHTGFVQQAEETKSTEAPLKGQGPGKEQAESAPEKGAANAKETAGKVRELGIQGQMIQTDLQKIHLKGSEKASDSHAGIIQPEDSPKGIIEPEDRTKSGTDLGKVTQPQGSPVGRLKW